MVSTKKIGIVSVFMNKGNNKYIVNAFFRGVLDFDPLFHLQPHFHFKCSPSPTQLRLLSCREDWTFWIPAIPRSQSDNQSQSRGEETIRKSPNIAQLLLLESQQAVSVGKPTK